MEEKQFTIRGKVLEVGDDQERHRAFEVLLQNDTVGLLRFDAPMTVTAEAGGMLYSEAEVTYVLGAFGHRRMLSIRRVES